ncbi:unnamed protein product [Chironomus riparius]|uniref:Aquaporin n=1 Tax=Chironomus riparius TaxID=315576 RepID=A0A9N9RLG8_9DIPT|nr:unnamed protein product [Chironomus riparius]
MGFMYIIAEVLGAILGYGALVALTPTKYFQSDPGENGLCITNLHPSVSVVQGFFIEFIITSVLAFFVCSIWDPRNKDKGDSASLKLGLAVAALCFAAAPATVASMNPARSIGPAVWNNEWENHWVYWTATMSGSLFSSYFYRIVFWKDPEQESTEL